MQIASLRSRFGLLMFSIQEPLDSHFRRPMPCASNQCNSAGRSVPSSRRTRQSPFSFLHRPRPYRFTSSGRLRTPFPTAMASMSVISPTSSNCTGHYRQHRVGTTPRTLRILPRRQAGLYLSAKASISVIPDRKNPKSVQNSTLRADTLQWLCRNGSRL
jgi:hypothetical protein